MNNSDLQKKLFNFFYHYRSGHNSIPQLTYIRISIIYLAAVVSAFAALPLGLLYFPSESRMIILSFQTALVLFILSGILFLITRNITLSKILIAAGFIITAIEEIIDIHNAPGMGPLVLLIIAPIFYLVFNIKAGVLFPLLLTAGTILRLAFGTFPPQSLLYSSTYRILYISVTVIGAIGSLGIVFCINYLIQRLYQFAFLDQITGLANKNKLTEDISTKCLAGKYYKKEFSIIGIEILNFNSLNSNLGTKNCDLILKAVAGRLLKNSSTLTGRWSGSVFITLIDTSKKNLVDDYCNFLLESLSDFYKIEQGNVFVQFAAAVSIFPEDGFTIETHTENIMSLFDGKTLHHGDIVYHDNEAVEKKHQRFKITDELGKAKLNSELSLFYQPKMNISDSSCMSAEALLRWTNNKLGTVSPVDFIPAAEESGLIRNITRWVIKKAFNDRVRLQETGLEGSSNFLFSVNLSIMDLKDRDFIQFLKQQLKETKCNPSKIEFEVTKSIQADNDPLILQNLDNLKQLGFRIAIDDFGKGYSSLSYIHQIDAHNLKIDKSFIDNIIEINDDISYPVIDAIISMGKSLGIEVTAEGVEEKIQLEYLKRKNCDTIQGWIYAKAMDFDKFSSF